jgi:hypothetical protein
MIVPLLRIQIDLKENLIDPSVLVQPFGDLFHKRGGLHRGTVLERLEGGRGAQLEIEDVFHFCMQILSHRGAQRRIRYFFALVLHSQRCPPPLPPPPALIHPITVSYGGFGEWKGPKTGRPDRIPLRKKGGHRGVHFLF